MPYTGWLRVGDVEVVNDARALARARHAGLTGVDVDGAEYLQLFLGQSYSGPVSTDDPWRSPDPASAKFLGIIGTAFSGLEASTQTRVVAPSASEGGTPQAPVAGPREISVSTLLLATDSIGLEYGFNWLASVLQQRRAQAYNAAIEQGYLSAAQLPSRWGAPPRPGGLAAPLKFLDADPADTRAATSNVRALYDVVLTDGPTIVAEYKLPPGCEGTEPARVAEVSFTLTAAPWIWQGVTQIAYTTLQAWPHAFGSAGNPWTQATNRPIKWVEYRTEDVSGSFIEHPVTPRGAEPLQAACSSGSGCPPARTLPRPAADIDWCAAVMPTVPRWGGLSDLKDVTGLVASWEYAPIVVIETGSALMRRASFRISRRLPGGFHDPTSLLVRQELNVPYLPAGSRCILDGRTRTAVVDCRPAGTAASIFANVRDAEPVPLAQYTPAVYGIGGAPATWPTFRGDDDLRFTCHAEDNFCAPDARFTLFLAARQALA
jgi:hypothetical protein